MNFSGISDRSVLGRILRWPLRLIPSELVLPILQGCLRGTRWIVGSSNHGCWLGSYEFEKRALFEQTVTAGTVVYDIGAHVGFYTLLASRLTGPRGKVIAFEPLPRNVRYLKRHLELNKVRNVRLVEAAASLSSGVANFHEGLNNSMGGLFSGGELMVKTVSIDELYYRGDIPGPNHVKMDIEGGEVDALVGMTAVLTLFKPTVFLATHGTEIHKQCVAFLQALRYNITPLGNNELVAYG